VAPYLSCSDDGGGVATMTSGVATTASVVTAASLKSMASVVTVAS
jgi:hypothetical protein